MIKINKLLEEKSSLQNEIYKYKDKLQKSAKEKETTSRYCLKFNRKDILK